MAKVNIEINAETKRVKKIMREGAEREKRGKRDKGERVR